MRAEMRRGRRCAAWQQAERHACKKVRIPYAKMRKRASSILLDIKPGQHLFPCMGDAGSDENEPLRRLLHGEKEGQSSGVSPGSKPVAQDRQQS